MIRKLTDRTIKASKTDGNPLKLSDGGGLFLLVKPTSKAWKYSYRFKNKQKTLSFGQYPEVSLSAARDKHQEARDRLANGSDPSGKKITVGVTFEDVANEWFEMKKGEWSDTHRIRTRRLLDQYILPYLDGQLIEKLEPPDILVVLKKMEAQGIISSMHKAKIVCGQVFRYGVALGVCKRDQTHDLKGALKAEKTKHFAAITEPKKIKELMLDIESYNGNFLTREGLKLLAHTFVRSGELRNAKRGEFDLEKAVWKIPADRMKNGKPHMVPLSSQAIVILKNIIEKYDAEPTKSDMRKDDGFRVESDFFLLPLIHSNIRPMSENTLNTAIRRMGYDKTQMTSHGFRAMASTTLNDMGFNPDAIEAQLSHVEGDSVRAAYNRGLYWSDRVKMMTDWSNYLDGLQDSK